MWKASNGSLNILKIVCNVIKTKRVRKTGLFGFCQTLLKYFFYIPDSNCTSKAEQRPGGVLYKL